MKYTIYGFIAMWMFVLGILVGRGNFPELIKTSGFQGKLEKIAIEADKRDKKNIELPPFDVLEKPPEKEPGLTGKKPTGPPPAALTQEKDPDGSVPEKLSMKKKTFKAQLNETVVSAPAQKKETHITQKKEVQAETQKGTDDAVKGRFTVQIASYQNEKDADNRVAELKRQGIRAYKAYGKKDGAIWYRVRSGSFDAYVKAKAYQQELKKKKIKSMIMNR